MAETNGNGPLTIREQLALPWGALLLSVPKRLLALISKVISFKGAAIILATVLLDRDVLESWHWLILVAAIVLGRDILDKIKK
jgi:hypothetical protein